MPTKEQIGIIVVWAIVAVLWWLLISIPAFIGKARKVSPQHLKLIRLMAICGLLIMLFVVAVNFAYSMVGDSESIAVILSLVWFISIGLGILLWLVALVLSIMFTSQKEPSPQTGYRVGESMVRSQSLSYPNPEGQPKRERAVATVISTDTATLDLCENCGRKIGKLETPNVWKDNVVCGICYKILSS